MSYLDTLHARYPETANNTTDKTDESTSVGFVSGGPHAFENEAAGMEAENELPLAAKLRAYGQPYPLTVDDTIKAWLVPDDEAAMRADVEGVVYTAAEVEHMASLSAQDVQYLHRLKATLGGTISPDDDL